MTDALELAQLEPPRTLREMASSRLRAAIVQGAFPTGHRLVERHLCDQLGVSRSVIREAIRTLETEGLVDVTGRAGPVVAGLDRDEARQIYGIRLLLEAAAAADCARRAGPAERAALARALDRLETASLSAPERLFDATTTFYEVLFRAAGHGVAWEVVQRLNGRISRLRALTLATRDRHVSGPARMARIAEAVLAGQPEAAAQAVQDHLTEAAALADRILTDGRNS